MARTAFLFSPWLYGHSSVSPPRLDHTHCMWCTLYHLHTGYSHTLAERGQKSSFKKDIEWKSQRSKGTHTFVLITNAFLHLNHNQNIICVYATNITDKCKCIHFGKDIWKLKVCLKLSSLFIHFLGTLVQLLVLFLVEANKRFDQMAWAKLCTRYATLKPRKKVTRWEKIMKTGAFFFKAGHWLVYEKVQNDIICRSKRKLSTSSITQNTEL